MWLDNVLERYIRPAALASGITKTIGWHTYRRSISSVLADVGTPQKIVSDLLRHAQISTTADLYEQSSAQARRAAQEHMKDLFAA
jgi:site-specific recombinase XerD